MSPDTAACTYTYLHTHPSPGDAVTAAYGGGGNDAGSTSSALDEVVGPAATTTTVTSAPTTPVSGQQVAVTATVAAVPAGLGLPTGSVEFSDSSGTLCPSVQFSDTSPDTATCDVTYNAATTDLVTASYGGAPDFSGSMGSGNVSVSAGASQVALQASDNPAVTGETPTFTATVGPMAPAVGTPTGTVTFSFTTSGGSPAPTCAGTGGDTVTVSGGVATCTLSSGLLPRESPVAVGAHYSGDDAFSASDAAPLSETVNEASTSVKVTSSANPVAPSSAVSFKAKVLVVSPGAGTPTGGTIAWTITNAGGKSMLCTSVSTVVTATTLKSTCTVAAGRLPAGKSPYTVRAAYSGTNKFSGSTGLLTETVS